MPQDHEVRAWQERIGPDASITHVSGGKKQFEAGAKQKSDVFKTKEPFLVDMPLRTPSEVTPVDTDHLIWRSYRIIACTDDGLAREGKQMHTKIPSSDKSLQHVRKCMREKLRAALREEQTLVKEQEDERKLWLERHRIHDEVQEQQLRLRAKEKGFDGLRKATLRPPPALPPVSAAAVDATLEATLPGMAYRTGGKRMFLNHASCICSGSPIGVVSGEVEPIKRWKAKSFT